MDIINIYFKEFERNSLEIEGWVTNYKSSNDYKRIKQLISENNDCVFFFTKYFEIQKDIID